MKLLLDQNLPGSLSKRLADLGCVIAHVKDFGLDAADDTHIWQMAVREDYTIVSKDDDFRIRAAAQGHPPKVIHLKIGNCSVARVEGVIRSAWPFVVKLHDDATASLLLITSETAFLLVHGGP